MEDHYETLPATRETHYETLPVPRVTDDHIYLDLMNNGKPKRPISLKSIENTAVKDIQYKDKKTQSSVTTQALETVILPSSKASNGKTKITKRVLIGICVVVVCLVVGTTVGIFVSSSGSSQTDDQEGNNVPAVTISKSAYTVKPGGSVTLNCIVSSTTNIENVYWQRTVNNDVTVIQTNKFKYSGSTPSIPSLTINNAGLRDAGQYQCFAENEAGTGQSVFTTLTVDKPCGLLKDGWKNFHGHYYIFITTVKTWKDAEEDCRYFSARLTEVQTRDEGQWLKNQARQKGGDWWLGASDEAIEGQWRWTSGNTLEQHTNWAQKKPDNNDGQDCLQMLASANYLWNDQTCTNKINYICEKSSC